MRRTFLATVSAENILRHANLPGNAVASIVSGQVRRFITPKET